MNFLAIFQRVRQWAVDLWQRTEKRERNRFFVIAGVMVVLIIFAVVLLNRTTYVTMMDGLDAESSNKVVAALSGYNYRLENNGSRILIADKDQVAASAHIAASGVLSNSPDYSTFLQGSGLMASQYEKEQWKIYQAEEDLRRYVRTMDNVSDAIVKLANTDKKISIFAQDNIPVTATVHVITTNGSIPSPELVTALKNGTAGAVSGLLPENVVITCQNGLVVDDMSKVYGDLYTNHLEFKNRVEADLEAGLHVLLDSVLGRDNYTVKTHAVLNFDEHSQQSTIYQPVTDESGIVESMQTVREIARGNGAAMGEPGIDENGGGDDYDEMESSDASFYEKAADTVNYQNSVINDQIVFAKGTLVNLTCAISVNSLEIDASSQVTQSLQAIAGGALGLVRSNYNLITVEFFPFEGLKASREAAESALADMRRQQTMELIRTLVLYVLIGICVLVLILKLYGLLRKEPEGTDEFQRALEEDYDPEMEEMAALLEMATLGEIGEAPKSPFRDQVEKFIDKNPSAVADLLRNWFGDDYY